MGSDIQIVEQIHATPNEELHGHFRVEPNEGGVLGIVGWALGARSPVTEIEVRSNGDVIASTALDVERPDIAEGFDSKNDALLSGFQISIEAQGAGESHLVIEAQLEDGTVTPLGELRVKAPRRGGLMKMFRQD